MEVSLELLIVSYLTVAGFSVAATVAVQSLIRAAKKCCKGKTREASVARNRASATFSPAKRMDRSFEERIANDDGGHYSSSAAFRQSNTNNPKPSTFLSVSNGRIYEDPRLVADSRYDSQSQQEENLPLRAFPVPRHYSRNRRDHRPHRRQQQPGSIFSRTDFVNPGVRRTYGNGIRRAVSTTAILSHYAPPAVTVPPRLPDVTHTSTTGGGYLAMDSSPKSEDLEPRESSKSQGVKGSSPSSDFPSTSPTASAYNVVELSALADNDRAERTFYTPSPVSGASSRVSEPFYDTLNRSQVAGREDDAFYSIRGSTKSPTSDTYCVVDEVENQYASLRRQRSEVEADAGAEGIEAATVDPLYDSVGQCDVHDASTLRVRPVNTSLCRPGTQQMTEVGWTGEEQNDSQNDTLTKF